MKRNFSVFSTLILPFCFILSPQVSVMTFSSSVSGTRRGCCGPLLAGWSEGSIIADWVIRPFLTAVRHNDNKLYSCFLLLKTRLKQVDKNGISFVKLKEITYLWQNWTSVLLKLLENKTKKTGSDSWFCVKINPSPPAIWISLLIQNFNNRIVIGRWSSSHKSNPLHYFSNAVCEYFFVFVSNWWDVNDKSDKIDKQNKKG